MNLTHLCKLALLAIAATVFSACTTDVNVEERHPHYSDPPRRHHDHHDRDNRVDVDVDIHRRH